MPLGRCRRRVRRTSRRSRARRSAPLRLGRDRRRLRARRRRRPSRSRPRPRRRGPAEAVDVRSDRGHGGPSRRRAVHVPGRGTPMLVARDRGALRRDRRSAIARPAHRCTSGALAAERIAHVSVSTPSSRVLEDRRRARVGEGSSTAGRAHPDDGRGRPRSTIDSHAAARRHRPGTGAPPSARSSVEAPRRRRSARADRERRQSGSHQAELVVDGARADVLGCSAREPLAVDARCSTPTVRGRNGELGADERASSRDD